MSEHWGYVCESHDPPLESDRWLNHGEDALIAAFRRERAGEWPNYPEDGPFNLAFEGEPFPVSRDEGVGYVGEWGTGNSDYCADGPVQWLRLHPHCKVALRNEYGDRREIGETVPGEVAPPAIEP